MTPERWQEIARLFHAALERDEAVRNSFLEDAAGEDADLRRQVTSLLDQESTSGPLDEPMLDSAAQVLDVEPCLTRGMRLGQYEIDDLLGVGGMGEVYRARDTKLGRHVALKLLPPDVEDDADRLARFEREAHVLASLNHPGIGAIYGVEEGTLGPPASNEVSAVRVHALVLELVEGTTLAERIDGRPIPLDEVVAIATQIAGALQAAHERGVVHRDLKPANIKLRGDGTVKVLDFGLAKLAGPTHGTGTDTSAALPRSDVLSTEANGLLGTAAYMSPEQARGEEADRRSDVWSLACVLYEMLTGKRAFAADTVAETLRLVLTSAPDWTALPPHTPESLRTLLERCLVKDRRRRVSDMAVVLYVMAERGDMAPLRREDKPVLQPRARRRIIAAAIIAAGLVLATALLWVKANRLETAAITPVRLEVATSAPDVLALGNLRSVAVSPDGRHVVYRAGPGWHLVIRRLDDLRLHPLDGTSGASTPFFSADGNAIAFVAAARLRRISRDGGTAVDLCPIEAPQRGGTWGLEDTIIFATSDRATGLLRVPSAGGAPQPLTHPDAAQAELDHWYPSFLPGNRGVLFTIVRSEPRASDIAVLDLATGRYNIVLHGGSQAEYISSGHLVYAAAGGIRAVRFDLRTLQVVGDPVAIVERVMTTSLGMSEFATSPAGTLVYVPDDAASPVAVRRSLVWVDRHGRAQPVGAPPRGFTTARLSRDGARVAVGMETPEASIWLWDLRRTTFTLLSSERGAETRPVWTPDGTHIIFTSSRDGSPNLYRQVADGSRPPALLFSTPRPQYATSVSPDGNRVFLSQLSGPTNRADVAALFVGDSPRLETVLTGAADEFNAELSPDGRWLAYQSDESGRHEVYLRPFPDVTAARVQVSIAGGTQPAWRSDNTELYYVDPNERLIAVPIHVAAGGGIAAGQPDALFHLADFVRAPNVATSGRAYDVAPDGRFLMIKNDAVSPDLRNPTSFIVVHNWGEELKARFPSR